MNDLHGSDQRTNGFDTKRSPELIGEFVLVSGSPRRKALLEQLGLAFSIVTPDVDETVGESLRPQAYVREVARRKLSRYMEGIRLPSDSEVTPGRGSAEEQLGKHVPLGKASRANRWALAGDTIVVHRGSVIGKPTDRRHAESILRSLSGRTHRVITALALFNPHNRTVTVETATTKVGFTRLSEEELHWYLQCGEWEGVAGAYRIQERGSVLVRRIAGSYSNVVGLPIELFYGMVQMQGYTLFPTGK